MVQQVSIRRQPKEMLDIGTTHLGQMATLESGSMLINTATMPKFTFQHAIDPAVTALNKSSISSRIGEYPLTSRAPSRFLRHLAVLIFYHMLVFRFRVFPFLMPVSSARLNCPELQ